jgi:amidase
MEDQALQNYKDVGAAALARRAAAIPEKYLMPEHELRNLPKNLTKIPAIRMNYTEREYEIITAEAEAILQKIRDRAWTAVQVTEAFCKAAAVANQLVFYCLILKLARPQY